jgi:hypothetical protein
MIDLQSRIAALPGWPDSPNYLGIGHYMNLTEAALARLELLREWVSASPHYNCPYLPAYGGLPMAPCTCGRDAILKATEVPR